MSKYCISPYYHQILCQFTFANKVVCGQFSELFLFVMIYIILLVWCLWFLCTQLLGLQPLNLPPLPYGTSSQEDYQETD